MQSPTKFQRALHVVLNYEGGYSNKPADPGGATNKGITQRVYDWWRHSKGLHVQSVKLITDAEVGAIYKELYYDPMHCDSFIYSIGILLFDSAVQWGVHGAFAQVLNPALKLPQTASPATTFLKLAQVKDISYLVNLIVNQRKSLRYERVRKSPQSIIFLKGWLARDDKLKNEALSSLPSVPTKS